MSVRVQKVTGKITSMGQDLMSAGLQKVTGTINKPGTNSDAWCPIKGKIS